MLFAGALWGGFWRLSKLRLARRRAKRLNTHTHTQTHPLGRLQTISSKMFSYSKMVFKYAYVCLNTPPEAASLPHYGGT
jgi:hypothetical protein